MSPETLDRGIRSVPPLPAMVERLLMILAKRDVDFRVLEQNINKDQALALRVLAVANSPLYGMSGRINSVKDACLVLGTDITRSIVVSVTIVGSFPQRKANCLDLAALWRHALATAASAKVLARLSGLDPETAFTAGLLHDVGKMVLDIYFVSEYVAVVRYRDAHDCLLREAEEAVLGMNHCTVGALAGRKWHLPETILEAIEHHHDIDSVPPSKIADLVHVADIVARGLEIGSGGDTLIPLLSAAALARLGITVAQIGERLAEIEQTNASVSAFID